MREVGVSAMSVDECLGLKSVISGGFQKEVPGGSLQVNDGLVS